MLARGNFQLHNSFDFCCIFQTYNVDKQVPDSAGTATAIFSGVKSRYKVIGLDVKASFNSCDSTVNEARKLTTLADWAQATGLDTGEKKIIIFHHHMLYA